MLTNDEKHKLKQEYYRLLVTFKNDPDVIKRLSEIEVSLGKSTEEMCAHSIKEYMDQY